MDYKTPLNDLIKYYRKQRGFSQIQLSEESGVAIATIKQIEGASFIHKKKTISIDTLFRLSRAMNLNPNDFIQPLWKIYTGQAETIADVFEKED